MPKDITEGDDFLGPASRNVLATERDARVFASQSLGRIGGKVDTEECAALSSAIVAAAS